MNRENLPLNITEKKRSRISLLCSVAVLLLTGFVIHQIDYSLIEKPVVEAQRKAEKEKAKAEKEAAKTTVTKASIVAVGNNILDTSLLMSGQDTSGNWSYDHLYTHVKEEIESADLALAAQSTILSPDHYMTSGAPSYLTPTEVGDALVNTGFDVIAGASCHSDDFGSSYITQTVNFWQNRHSQIPILGIHGTTDSASTIQVVNINDIRIAFLNYTYGTRNDALSAEEAYMIDTFEKEQVTAAVSEAKKQSDCVIFIAHWGDENSSVPNEYQKQWASYLMSLGVNVIIGNHPMSLQPFGTMADGNGKETTVFYSLGNFLSIQDTVTGTLGGMAKFTIEKTVKGGKTSIDILDETIEPLVMHYNYMTGEYGPYLLRDYTNELASQNSINQTFMMGETFTPESLQQQFDETMSVTVAPSTATNLIDGTPDPSAAGTSSGGTASDGTGASKPGSVPNGTPATYDENGGYYDAEGNYYDTYGNVYTASGYYDANGNFYGY